MALKLELDSLDGVDESVKLLYKENNGKFRLDVDGVPDVEGLKKKNEELLAEKKEAARKAKESAEQAEAARLEAATKSGNVESLTKSWEEKYNSALSAKDKEIADTKRLITSVTVDATATALAAKLAVPGCAEGLLPHIRSRLASDVRDGRPVTIVLDKNGQPSAQTVEEFEAEVKAVPYLAGLISGSRASGGGHQGNGSGGGASGSEIMNLPPVERMNAARASQRII